MRDTTAMPMHAEWPPSKEWPVPMEVVVEASPVSTQDMEVNKDLKKWARTKPIMTSTTDIVMKESLEQKRIWNEEEAMETKAVHVLFMDSEEKIYGEEDNDSNTAHKVKDQKIATINTNKQLEIPTMRDKQANKTNKKETQDEEPLTIAEAPNRMHDLTTSSKEIEPGEEEEQDKSTEEGEDDQETLAEDTDSATEKNPESSRNKQPEEPNQDKQQELEEEKKPLHFKCYLSKPIACKEDPHWCSFN